MSTAAVVVGVLAWRVAGALLQQTYFVPDEHWQGPEVAHKMVFGYGHETWEWHAGLRGYLHPGLIALFFKAAQMTGADSPAVIFLIPKLFSALVASVGDLATFALARRLFPATPRAAHCALTCQLLNLSYFFCMTRPLSNSLEAALSAAALALWPLPAPAAPSTRLQRLASFFLAALSFATRPTAALLFVPLAIIQMDRGTASLGSHIRFLLVRFTEAALGLGAGGAVMACVDRVGYGRWTLPPLNFLEFNVLTHGASLYGEQPWYWYLSQGGFILLATSIPLVGNGIKKCHPALRAPAFAAAAYVAVHSALGHKEFRFLLPLVPIAMAYAGSALSAANSAKQFWGWTIILAVTNVVPAVYISTVHQRGAVDVMHHISATAASRELLLAATLAPGEAVAPGGGMSVLFLTPCHSTPYYSSLHRNISLRFLDCSPPSFRLLAPLDAKCIDEKNATRGPDEADRFYKNPEKFLRCAFGTKSEGADDDTWLGWGAAYLGVEEYVGEYLGTGAAPPAGGANSLPTHVVLYSGLLEQVEGLLGELGFTRDVSLFHTHALVESRISKTIEVWERKKKAPSSLA